MTTPLQRLLDDITPPAGGTGGGTNQVNWALPAGETMRGTTGDSVRALLRDVVARLDAADTVYPGIRSAIDRGVFDRADAALLDLGSAFLAAQERADQADRLADDRLQGARALHIELSAERRTARLLNGATEQNGRLQALVDELEATIRRISGNPTRVIAGCRSRAEAAAGQTEPF